MSLLQRAPRFAAVDAARMARERYALEATATPLPSERDQNFLLETTSGERFVLKIANATEPAAILEAQNAAMAHLAGTGTCPRVVFDRTGSAIATEAGSDGAPHFVRLVTWLPGVTLASVRWHSSALLESLGARLAELDRALTAFDHPALHREFHWDLASGFRIVRDHAPLVADAALGELVARAAERIEREEGPRIARLPRSIIHNDANDHNVIVGGNGDLYARNQRVIGFIDFGDMVHGATVADLAVAAAYAALDKADPLAAAAAIVRGYHAVRPLDVDEIGALFALVLLRLCMSVCLAARQQRERPGDEYLLVSQRAIGGTLPALLETHPRFAEALFRQACGLEPVAKAGRIVPWLRSTEAAHVLDQPLDARSAVVVDLSAAGPLISGDARENEAAALTRRIEAAMQAAAARVAIGRYDEARVVYSSPLFRSARTNDTRTVHLGIDLFAPPGTPVHAPADGRVHAVAENASPLDYGPVVILRHEAGEDTFYTLYGHLGRECLTGLRPGQSIGRGEPFATIGTMHVNGGWPPHLHFQVIVDLLDRGTDFPGVCRGAEREIWKSLSPDPNLLLRIPEDRLSPPAPGRTATLAARRRAIGRNVRLGYRDPLKIVRGWMQYLYDESGRRYLDAYNNVPHVGHAHPRVAGAIDAQMRVLNTNTRYLHDTIVRYAERLLATLPAPLSICYFVNSGSEANELALRLARAHTRRRDVIVLDAAYHGNTTTLVEISPYKFNGPGGSGAPPWVHVAPLPDVYRGAYKKDDPRAGERYASAVAAAIARLQAAGGGIAAFIAETCPSVGGQIVFPPGYLEAVYAHVRGAGGVVIADEVQTAYGRMGTSFYAFQDQNVVPDIVVLGKPIGNGHPIGAVITTDEVARSFDNGMEFFSTFGGNTVSCAAGLSVLEIVQQENLQGHARRVGAHLIGRLESLRDRYPLVGDVRGSGFFVGVELVTDRTSLEPAREEAAFAINRMREEGVLLGTDGPFHNVLKIRPPMPFTAADADVLVETLDRVLAEVPG